MAEHDPTRRTLDAEEVQHLKTFGKLETLGGFTLAALLAAANEAGIGPEDLEITGDGDSYGIGLFVVQPEENADA